MGRLPGLLRDGVEAASRKEPQVNERQAFEAWAVKTICHQSDLQRGELTGYRSQELNYLWRGWQAARAASPVPAGWKLVPVEPTSDMLYAMAEQDGWRRGDREHPMLTRWEDYWRSALGASPASQPPQGAQQGWQPIETAPTGRDSEGRMQCVLVACGGTGGPYACEAWFDEDVDQWWPANTDYTDAHGTQIYPTHWMPLPAPPSQEGETR
jgi:hypothetical protein